MQRAHLARFDWILLGSAVFLVLLGLLSIASTSPDGSFRPLYQLALAGGGFALLAVLALYEYRTLTSYAGFFYGGGLLLLVGVLVAGTVRNSARSWFDLGVVVLQPSEPMKLALILLLATVFARRARHTRIDILRSAVILAAPLGLILLQPDLGTALSYLALWGAMLTGLHLSRADKLLVVGTVLTGAAIAVGSLFLFAQSDNYQLQRLQVFPDHLLLRDVRHTDIGYQVDQSLIAIGSTGTFFGTGLGRGTQTHLGFLPAAQTDFIAAAIAEELGFFGILLLLALSTVLLARILIIARQSIDSFGSFVCLGVFGLILFHLVENVGMNLGLLPVTGIPLLLVSAGGSHLVTTLMALGIVESIAIRSQRIKV